MALMSSSGKSMSRSEYLASSKSSFNMKAKKKSNKSRKSKRSKSLSKGYGHGPVRTRYSASVASQLPKPKLDSQGNAVIWLSKDSYQVLRPFMFRRVNGVIHELHHSLWDARRAELGMRPAAPIPNTDTNKSSINTPSASQEYADDLVLEQMDWLLYN